MRAEGRTYGSCEELDGLCHESADCYGGQFCEVHSGDELGCCTD